MTRKKSKVLQVHPVDEGHQVLTLKSESKAYRREPCPGCPWKTENAGTFPADAFVVSARTAYDMAQSVFSCHESGSKAPATCAGFLLKGSMHNLSVRMGLHSGRYKMDVTDGGHELFSSYRAMAEANGVPPDHESLTACRSAEE